MLHVTKGVFGLRLDNVYNVSINDLTIDDLQNVGELGSYICGNYESSSDGGHRNQVCLQFYYFAMLPISSVVCLVSCVQVDMVRSMVPCLAEKQFFSENA